jgi:hypothetical protein
VSTPTPLLVYSPTPFFKEVRFPSEGDGCHPRKWVGYAIHVGLLEGNHEEIGTELDVFTQHEHG